MVNLGRNVPFGVVLTGVLVSFFLSLILLSSLASAFSFDMNVSNSRPQISKPITFGLLMNVPAGERVPVEDFTLEVFDADHPGSSLVVCNFYVNGTEISGCNGSGVIISKLSVPSNYAFGNLSGTDEGGNGNLETWGTGMGYSNGNFVYRAYYNTSALSEGNYHSIFKFSIPVPSRTFASPEINFTIMEPVSLSLFDFSPSCVYENQTVSVKAGVTGSIRSVIVSINYGNGTITNKTAIKSGDNYSYSLSGLGGQNLSWKFVVKDLSGTTLNSAVQSIYFLKRTKISLSPSVPNGLNGWYVTEPFMSLSNPDSFNISYRWDSAAPRLYVSPFNLTNIPNPPPQTAGRLKLTYWAETSCGVEPSQIANIFVDLTTPSLGSFVPLDGAVINNKNPRVSLVVDEIYGDNSDINKSSLVMRMDNISYKVNASELTGTKLSVYRNFMNLSEGKHSVLVSGMDNAGHSFSTNWSFEFVSDSSSNLAVYSPLGGISGIRQVLFNITVKNPSRIEYSDNSGRWMVLCTTCTKISKKVSFSEGYHEVVLRATDIYSNQDEKNLNFSIDSKKPRISSIKPRSNEYVNGDSEFVIKYSEDNLKSVVLYYGNSSDVHAQSLSCDSGNSEECSGKVNLTDFDGQTILYWFEVSDYVTSTLSRQVKVRVDTTVPILNVISPSFDENGTEMNYQRNVLFNFSMSEKSIIEYMDIDAHYPSWTKICIDCSNYNGFKRFSLGVHDLTIRASDRAGNFDEKEVSFFVV